jgi:hypothetical protein
MERSEAILLAELRKDLSALHWNAVFGEIAQDLVDDILVTRIHHAGKHDLEGVNSLTFLRQPKLRCSPEAESRVAASVPAIRGVGGELRGEILRGRSDCVRHVWFLCIVAG